jgi:DNA-binding MarR family transcriptional regulator
MKNKNKKYELSDEHFDEYFFQALSEMTVEQKERLPDDLFSKFRFGAQRALDLLTFDEKLYILTRVLNRRWVLMVESENGISYEAFLDLQKSYAGLAPRLEALTDLRRSGTFLLGAQQLMKRLEYVTMLCATNIYKTIVGYRADINEKRKQITAQRNITESVKGILNFLIHYETSKYKLQQAYGISNISEWLVLMYYYAKEEDTRSQLNVRMAYAVHSNKCDRGKALSKLLHLGFLDIQGRKHTIHTKYYLTPKGKELVIKILERLFLNY